METRTGGGAKECIGGLPACVDCNICLGAVAEPVVTLCGHLYCRPCLRRWRRSGQPGAGRCPVCKAAVSEDHLVPLYGRGRAAPRPCDDDGQVQLQQRAYGVGNQRTRRRGAAAAGGAVDCRCMYSAVLRSNAGCVIGSVAVAVLPWAFPGGQFARRFSADTMDRSRGGWRTRCTRHGFFLPPFAFLCFLIF